jgi:hypothetical protein
MGIGAQPVKMGAAGVWGGGKMIGEARQNSLLLRKGSAVNPGHRFDNGRLFVQLLLADSGAGGAASLLLGFLRSLAGGNMGFDVGKDLLLEGPTLGNGVVLLLRAGLATSLLLSAASLAAGLLDLLLDLVLVFVGSTLRLDLW